MKNTAQINGILRIIIGAGTPLGVYLAAHGINPNDLTDWIITGIPILMAIWSGFAHTQANQALVTGDIPGVKVVVSTAAPESVQAVAKNTSPETKNVEMSPPAVLINEKVADAKKRGGTRRPDE
jgi:hypothetical protein